MRFEQDGARQPFAVSMQLWKTELSGPQHVVASQAAQYACPWLMERMLCYERWQALGRHLAAKCTDRRKNLHIGHVLLGA